MVLLAIKTPLKVACMAKESIVMTLIMVFPELSRFSPEGIVSQYIRLDKACFVSGRVHAGDSVQTDRHP